MPENVESAVEPLVLTIREAARAAHVSERLLRKLVSSRRLAVVRIGRAVRVPRGEVLRLCGVDDRRAEDRPTDAQVPEARDDG